MKTTPAYILRNCALWVDNDVKVGQFSEVKIPAVKEKSEGVRNGGMIKERQVALGFELGDLEWSMLAFDPETFKLLSGKPGTDTSFMVTGALVDEDGTTNNATLTARGRITSNEPDGWKPGDKAEIKCMATLNYAKLEVAGAEVFEIDDFDYSIGGVSQTGDIRTALLL